IVAAIGAVVMTYAKPSVAAEIAGDRIYLFYTCFLLSLTGLLGMTITGDAFNLFVFLEISSLSSYVLISLGRDKRALTASYRYLILGTIGATFYVIGLGLMYVMTGTLNFVDLAERLPAVAGTGTILVALSFLTVGISLKLALFPLHLWLPNAYAYAPSVVTAFLAATATKVAVYVLLRIFFTVFGPSGIFTTAGVAETLLVLAVLGMFAASTVAIFQNNVKRMLAYSSVAQIGYVILGIGLANHLGVTAGILHLFNHAIIKSALFLAVGCIFLRTGSVNLSDFQGLGRRMPVTMAVFVVGGLSLIGVPLTVGFVSKWYLIIAALDKGLWPVAFLVLLSSLLAVIYVWRVVEVAYFKPPPADIPDHKGLEAPSIMLVPTVLMAAAAIYFGIDTDLSVGIAEKAAVALMGGAP
ncbi:MAG: monovalent cation/H+ antiporter subunit D family protein, partial [Rhodospirillales bacterium]|nr:monovalent cation/H+ antiporter subunit D family protein [Rhodospirillales bacterium]